MTTEISRRSPAPACAARRIHHIRVGGRHAIRFKPEWIDAWLQTIPNGQVQRLKLQLHDTSPKTINNVLSVLNVLLKQAVEWGFHDFDDYERLLKASQPIDPRSYLIALLGGEAGFRAGEIVALEWTDVDLERRQIRVRHSDGAAN